jgi:hypothetical protein
MATADDTAAEIVTEPAADAPLLLSAHPDVECPECGAGGFKKAIDLTATAGERGGGSTESRFRPLSSVKPVACSPRRSSDGGRRRVLLSEWRAERD